MVGVATRAGCCDAGVVIGRVTCYGPPVGALPFLGTCQYSWPQQAQLVLMPILRRYMERCCYPDKAILTSASCGEHGV
jgi:hypothetical protein